jgi:hypothetical protein
VVSPGLDHHPQQVDANVDVRGHLKPSDSRAQTYVAEYGERCWEVDILPANVIETALADEIDGWLNTRLWRRRAAAIERARRLL